MEKLNPYKNRLHLFPPRYFNVVYPISGFPCGKGPTIRLSPQPEVMQNPYKVGKPFDVISLLSTTDENTGYNYLVRNNGEERVGVECLKGKYIMFCCFYNPRKSHVVQAISIASSELSVRDDFELVVVLVGKIKAKPGCCVTDEEEAFNGFLSNFSCLSVPFSESQRRDYICMSVNPNYIPLSCFLVDPNQEVVHDSSLFLLQVGADSFPFNKIPYYDKKTCFKGQSLDELVCSSTSTTSDFLCKNDAAAAAAGEPPEKVFISQLKEKLVGLYLCSTGKDITVLDKVHQQCRARGLEFEIVLVYIPFIYFTRSTESFRELIDRDLESRGISWWVFPFNNSVCRRLYRMCEEPEGDTLIVVGPHGKFLDPEGELVVRHFGIDGYPFTKEAIINAEVQRLRQITLESLLVGGGGYVCRGNNDSAWVSLSVLQGKNIFLYLGFAQQYLSLLDSLLNKWYYQVKAKDPDFEVVFVCLDKSLSYSGNACLASMPWLVLPFNPSNSDLLTKALFPRCRFTIETLVAFGRDGWIRSLCAQYLLSAPDAFPFPDNLREELANDVDGFGFEVLSAKFNGYDV